MFRAGAGPETLLLASLGATVMGIWSITTVGAADAIQRQRWAGVLELLVAAPTPFWAVLLPITIATSTIGIYALARSMLGGHRAPWAAAWLFLGLNWIEQDYFSPQATGIVLMLTPLVFALGPL
ncbi:hypothetical protein QML35_27265, partial [Klebsiella pneumoniae]|uniref:hypothetical protein n=1 Tax=Klebsiella pneumoniae TaxID=573 RepID=UPI003A803A08